MTFYGLVEPPPREFGPVEKWRATDNERMPDFLFEYIETKHSTD
jgi:hypothetical protein